MKGIRQLFLVSLLVLSTLVLSAQERELPKYNYEVGTYERVAKKGSYQTNKFFDNWFIGVAGGVNIYTGHVDASPSGSFGWRNAPAIDLSVGKWIVPSFGLRAQASGLWARGWSWQQTDYTTSRKDNGIYRKSFNSVNVHADMLFNISNAIGGYRSDRFWSFIPYVGFGVAHSWKGSSKTVTHFAPTFGLLNNLRLGKVVDLTIEAKHMIVKPDYDKFSGGKKLDGQFTLTAGLTFKLGPKQGFKRPQAAIAPDYTPYISAIDKLEGDLDAAMREIDELARKLEAERNKPVKKESVAAPISMTVFFNIGQSYLMDKDMMNVESIASAIKATPNKTYTITGYADSQTGSKQRNDILSRQRAESVANALIKLGVNKDQLKIVSKGGVHEHDKLELDRRALVRIE